MGKIPAGHGLVNAHHPRGIFGITLGHIAAPDQGDLKAGKKAGTDLVIEGLGGVFDGDFRAADHLEITLSRPSPGGAILLIPTDITPGSAAMRSSAR